MYAVVSSCVCSLDSIKKLKEAIQPETWMDCLRLCNRVEVFSNLLNELKSYPHLLKDTDGEEQSLLKELEQVLIAVEAFVTDFVHRTSFKGITEATFRNGSSTDFGKLTQQIVKLSNSLNIESADSLFDDMRQEDFEDQRKTFQFAVTKVLQEISEANDFYIDQSFETLRQDIDQYPQQISKFLSACKHMGLTISETKALKVDVELMKKTLDDKISERLKSCLTNYSSPNTSSEGGGKNFASSVENGKALYMPNELFSKLVNGDNLNNEEKNEKKKLLSQLRVTNEELAVSRVRIGQGGFGDVYLGTFRRKYKVAIKTIRNNEDPYAENKKKSIENELLLMKFLGSYPTILSCYGYTMENDSLQIILELAPFGSLDQMLRDKNIFKSFPTHLSIAWLCDLADAIKFLHSKGIKHRDIKAENMLVFDKFHVKLCDFGPAKQHIANITAESKVGTFAFMAPEIRIGQTSEFASDIFSFAMTAIQVFTRRTPKIDDYNNQITNALKELNLSDIIANDKLYQLLQGCIKYDPDIHPNELRPNAETVSFQLIYTLEMIGGDPRDDEEKIKGLLSIAKKKENDRFRSIMSKANGANMFRPTSLSRKNSPHVLHMGSSNERLLAKSFQPSAPPLQLQSPASESTDCISVYSSNPGSPISGNSRSASLNNLNIYSSSATTSAASSSTGVGGAITSNDEEDKNQLIRYLHYTINIPLNESSLIADVLIKNSVANIDVLRRRLTRNEEFLLDLGIEDQLNDMIYDDIIVKNGKANLSASSTIMSPRPTNSSAKSRRRNAVSPSNHDLLPSEISRLYYDAAHLNKPEAFDVLIDLIDKGDKLAECFIMRMYALGQGPIKKDIHRAKDMGSYLLPWLRDVIELNDLSSIYIRYLIGVCYAEGLGTTQDQREAVRWCRQSAEEGYAAAQAYLGYCYFSGLGVPRNPDEAVKWYRMGADQGYAPAQCNLGLCYEQGLGVPMNAETAVKWYRLSADQGDCAALYNLGYCYEKGLGVPEDIREAVRFYKCSAGAGYTAAQYNLGVCYYFGTGVDQNMEQSVTWYRIAAEKGFAPAQCNLGLCYENGHGIEKDLEEAVYWYRQATEQGHPAAAYYLGFCYFSGMGVDKSVEEAVKYYKLSSEKKYPPALNNLGFCYFNGLGVPKNYSMAVKYYRSSAELGYAPAQYNMGYCYEKGYGVITKTQNIIRWYRIAAENGSEKAKKALTRFQS